MCVVFFSNILFLKTIAANTDIRLYSMKLTSDNRQYKERETTEGLYTFKPRLRNMDDAVFIKIRSETVLLGRLCAFTSTLQ